jgi:predicted RNase H-like nuclease (RuvC/YqgF family)
MYVTYQQYFQMIEQKLFQLENKQKELEEDNKRLKEQLDQLKPLHIENINYKIQELTVQNLSGTLNIGLTALTDQEHLNKLMKDAEEQAGEFKMMNTDTTEIPEEG